MNSEGKLDCSVYTHTCGAGSNHFSPMGGLEKKRRSKFLEARLVHEGAHRLDKSTRILSRQGVTPPALEELKKNNAGEATDSSRITPESLLNASKLDHHLSESF